MGATSYRVPVTPIVTGSNELTTLPLGNGDLPLRGAAWNSDVRIARVDISINFGQSWQQTGITAPTNCYDWTPEGRTQ